MDKRSVSVGKEQVSCGVCGAELFPTTAVQQYLPWVSTGSATGLLVVHEDTGDVIHACGEFERREEDG